MRSLIVLEVEHDETTDTLEDLANFLVCNGEVPGAKVKDYTVRVDISKPVCIITDAPWENPDDCTTHAHERG